MGYKFYKFTDSNPPINTNIELAPTLEPTSTPSLLNALKNTTIKNIIITDKRVYDHIQDLGTPIKIEESELNDKIIIDILTDKGYLVTFKIKKDNKNEKEWERKNES